MAKKKKNSMVVRDTPKIPFVKAPEVLLRIGDEILCVTQYTVDKSFVKEVNRETKVALLGNQVKLSAIIHSNGVLTRLGVTNVNATYKLWSDEVEKEYQYRIAKQSMKTLLNAISTGIDSLAREDTVTIYKKLKKLSKKFNIIIT